MADARGRKRAKYHDLEEAGRVACYKTELISIEVGSRGMVCSADLEILKAAVSATEKDITNLCLEVIRTILQESYGFLGTLPSEFSCIAAIILNT